MRPAVARPILLLLVVSLPMAAFAVYLPIAGTAAPRTAAEPCPDYDGDGLVAVADVQAVAARWRLAASAFDPDGDPATPNYAARFDLDGDGVITVRDIQDAAAQLGRSCPCTPAIEFTHVPAVGSSENLAGRVLCADPASYTVAAFIYVNGWYNKPTWAQPLTPIAADGTWTADITSSINDPQATQVAAFLLPAGVTPPSLDGPGVFPVDLWNQGAAHRITSRVASPRMIQFAGYSWTVKASAGPVGPGPNYFSDQPADVAVDAEGRLRLHIGQRAGQWYSTEVVTAAALGYGNYLFRIAPLGRALDPNAVIGLFTWDSAAPQANFRELDVELARWGQPANAIAQFVVQPYDHPGNMHRFDLNLLAGSTRHCFTWGPTSVAFQSRWDAGVCPGPASDAIAAWTYTGADIPPADAGNARINLWLMGGNPPTNGLPIEVIIEGFSFTG